MDAATQASLGRMIDANANRVREGLRVMEDVARFAWDDAALVESCKKLRHALLPALQIIEAKLGALVQYRDTPGDVGTGCTTASEGQRADFADLFWASAKRVQEGLRVLEEAAKLIPLEPNPFKPLRYAAYTLETQAAVLHPFASSPLEVT